MNWHWFHPLAASPYGVASVALAVLVALAVDRWWGEPGARWHPVVWMGKALGYCGARMAPAARTPRKFKTFWLAAFVWCALAALVVIAAFAVQAIVLWLSGLAVEPMNGEKTAAGQAALVAVLSAALIGLLLKPLLALALLQSEARAVEGALSNSLEAGRARLAWLVSRDVTHLNADEVRQSAIESLAENLNDSVVAPLFWFALLGLPGAALYRFANTADAMWGYPGMRDGRYWQWAGKWAARADDVLSWLPARLTALLLALVAGGVPLAPLAREARKTPSPNSGWPMAAMALALGVRLAKPGVYELNAPGRAPTAGDAERAHHLVSKVALALILLALAAIVFVIFGVIA